MCLANAVQPRSRPSSWKRSSLEAAQFSLKVVQSKSFFTAKLGEHVDGSLGITQLVILVYPIKGDVSSLALINCNETFVSVIVQSDCEDSLLLPCKSL